jgi:hypothetical protein
MRFRTGMVSLLCDQLSPILSFLHASHVLHHLYSRAPTALKSPFTLLGLKPHQYAQWLAQHTERERIEAVVASLDEYSRAVQV